MRAIVVGGTKGIGKAITERLRKDDHEVVTLARENAHLRFDLSWTEEQIHTACMIAADALDGVDWLVLSAGMGAYIPTVGMTSERVQEMFRVNVFGPIQVYRSLLRPLMKSRGKVLFITSTVASRGAKGLSVYGATKGAINAFVRSEARGLAKHGVGMNALAPGWVDTDMTAEIAPRLREAIVNSIPSRRMAFPEEVAAAAVAILEMPHYATASVYDIAGGM